MGNKPSEHGLDELINLGLKVFPICYGGCEYRNQISGFHCEKAQFYANDIPLIKEMANAGNQRLEEEL